MNKHPVIFGEVLFDCFPDGKQVLGGAPFNVAWHLHAFGNTPHFISRVGMDERGDHILETMKTWGMSTDNIQKDSHYPTGYVDIRLVDDEPEYTITPDCAYDYIEPGKIKLPEENTILYHGTLATRNSVSRNTLSKIIKDNAFQIFLDANLRAPWWDKDSVLSLVKQATWLKLNIDELGLLTGSDADQNSNMAAFRDDNQLDLLIVTQGAEGASVVTDKGLLKFKPQPAEHFVDTVGAGDAFTSVFLRGLLEQWSVDEILEKAQSFASAVVGLRGALTEDPEFYNRFK